MAVKQNKNSYSTKVPLNINEEDTLLRLEEINETLASPPKWVFRWGISVIFIIIFICLSITSFIQYPNIISSRSVIMSQTDITGKLQFVTKVVLPIQNAFKIKIGQKVNLKIDNYPFIEYGIIPGVVKSISILGNKNICTIDIELTNALKTTFNKNILYSENMTGTSDIISEDKSVFDRIILKFKKINQN